MFLDLRSKVGKVVTTKTNTLYFKKFLSVAHAKFKPLCWTYYSLSRRDQLKKKQDWYQWLEFTLENVPRDYIFLFEVSNFELLV